jgi:hypothetical protein
VPVVERLIADVRGQQRREEDQGCVLREAAL